MHEFKMSYTEVESLDYNLFCHYAAYLMRKEEMVEKTDYYLCRLMSIVASLFSKRSYTPKDFLLGETPGDVLDARTCPEDTLRAALLATLGPGLTQEQIDALPDEVKDRTHLING